MLDDGQMFLDSLANFAKIVLCEFIVTDVTAATGLVDISFMLN